MSPSRTILFPLLLLALCAAFGSAQESRWEFGVDGGLIVPLSKNNFSHQIDNQVVYTLLANEGVGDEVAEGFTAPPRPGWSTVAGSLRDIPEIGLHVYRRVTSWLAAGLEGGYGFKRSIYLDNPGVYHQRFLDITYETNIIHVTPAVKLGRWFGRIKPSLAVGAGWYLYREFAQAAFTDPDDRLSPVVIFSQNNQFFGLNTAAAVDVKCTENGSVGLDVQYHKVFSPGGKLDFILPRLRLIVHFGGDTYW